MSLFGNLFGRRQSSQPTDTPAAFRALAADLPADGLASLLLTRTADSIGETTATLQQRGLSVPAMPLPETIESAMGSAVVMTAEAFVLPALAKEAATPDVDDAGVLFGMLVAFNLACQVKADVPGLEPQDVMTASFQAFSLGREADDQARLAPLVLDGFQRIFSGDEPSAGQVSQQVFEYVVLLIAHLQGDERISASALAYEALDVLPEIRRIIA